MSDVSSSYIPRRLTLLVLALVSAVASLLTTLPTGALPYGSGTYGSCQYDTCGLTLTTSTTVPVNVTPVSGSTRCTVAADTVTVTADASTGYTLTLIDGNTTNTLTSGANTIAATAGTYASPAALVAGRWGYRVDGRGNFGAGPTSAFSNGAAPSQTYAAVPVSTGTADTIATQASAAGSGVVTSVWYGVCVNAAQVSGTYTDSVLYTAVTN